jgi:hypothetical protein
VYTFSHKAYPIGASGDTEQECTQRYIAWLGNFIHERLNNNLSLQTEAQTSGRGGKRAGAGRPKGSKKEPTKVIRLPDYVVEWLNEDKNLVHLKNIAKKARPLG